MGNPDCNNTVLFRTLNPLHSSQPQIIKACWPKLLDRPHPASHQKHATSGIQDLVATSSCVSET